jgi:hypothetical protein
LKKNPKYKTPAKFTTGFVDIFVRLLRYFTNRSDPEREGSRISVFTSTFTSKTNENEPPNLCVNICAKNYTSYKYKEKD